MIVQGADQINKTLETDVCIVGTGPAGCTAAWFLVRQGLKVILLEGSRQKWPSPNEEVVNNAYLYNENDLLYNGQTAALMLNNEPEFLIRPSPTVGAASPTERERIYGGTGTHWGGQSRPLDPVVFEKRPGFQGWPVTRAELDPYYDLASDFCCLYGDYYGPDGTSGYNFTGEFWSDETDIPVPGPLDGFDFTMYQFFDNRQFQAKRVEGVTIGERPEATVILNASALTTHASGTRNYVTVGVLKDDGSGSAGTFTVQASKVVLACGAVANARQLLLSGLGGDQVGRYFSAHPLASGAGAVQVNGSIPIGLFLFQSPPAEVTKNSNTYAIAGKWVLNAAKTIELATNRAWFTNTGTDNFYHGTLPSPDSRVTLLENSEDVFGQQQTLLTWVLAERSEEDYYAQTAFFKESLLNSFGSQVSGVTIASWEKVKGGMVINGHHLCTTRMGWTVEDSVVDANLQVHGTNGVFVAGSSVWASTGISNPTFSIIAFSIRLADFIGKELGKDGVTRVRACGRAGLPEKSPRQIALDSFRPLWDLDQETDGEAADQDE